MRITDIILKKREGQALTEAEIKFFIDGYVKNEIPDYQISALLMAIFFQGMSITEITYLTQIMASSGDIINLDAVGKLCVDKHSTGGVADTTTLITAPLVASCGGYVAKMSGRGLGHTGGTIDKLEAIPGYKVDLDLPAFINVVKTCGVSIVSQTGKLVPADKKLYALRDVTQTVDNIALIASSIMSKKLALGTAAIVLDVKTGSGAFMLDQEATIGLAEIMVQIGAKSKRKVIVLVTDMNQPWGKAVGNAWVVEEACEGM